MAKSDTTDVVVAVCTYNRNAELDHLLGTLAEYGERYWSGCRLGVTIVDDSADGNARPTVERHADRFPLGLAYENSASRNIATARNFALERSMHRAPWVAMTDDDCEPCESWLSELVRIAGAAQADVATGLMLRRAPSHAPRWIKRQPFLQLGEFQADDGEELAVANTNNALISSAFLLARPHLRFDPNFGRIGGEDMKFFHAVKDAGAKIVYAAKAFVYENEPDARLTVRYQLRRFFWHGNSSAVTRLQRGVGRGRLSVNGVATIGRGVVRPLAQIVRGAPPHLLFATAKVLEGVGILAGVVGLKVKHK